MSMLAILLTSTAVVQTVLGGVCFLQYRQTRLPALLLVSLAPGYALTATFGYECLASVHRASSLDPVADWIDLLIQHVFLTGSLFAGACAANIWLAFRISVDTNAKGRSTVVDADGQQPVS
jgi:hypothetical protein